LKDEKTHGKELCRDLKTSIWDLNQPIWTMEIAFSNMTILQLRYSHRAKIIIETEILFIGRWAP